MTPLQKAAYDIGAKGSEPTENERLAFEAWMRGHCWKVVGDWDGKQYKHDCEDGEFVHGGAMNTRRLWAAWRDRGAVARSTLEAQQVAVPLPLTDDEIMQLGRLAADQEIDISKPTWEQFSLHLARAIEAHHGIGEKPSHTDWSAA